MKPLKIELPDYTWVALKKRTAEEMVSLRYFIMQALREKGIPITDIDMVEDGRRLPTILVNWANGHLLKIRQLEDNNALLSCGLPVRNNRQHNIAITIG